MFGAISATVSPRPMPRRASAEASLRQRRCVSAQLRRIEPWIIAKRLGKIEAARGRNESGESGS